MPEIKIYPAPDAKKILYDRIAEAGGIKVQLFKARLQEFLGHMLKTFVLGHCDKEAADMLIAASADTGSESGNTKVGGVDFFSADYCIMALYGEAERFGLPAAAIKSDLTKLTCKLYLEGYVLGEPVHDKAKAALLGHTNPVTMTLRKKELAPEQK